MEQRHWHALTVDNEWRQDDYELGPAEGMLVARVPVYGKLRFLRPAGASPPQKGINVGDEWTYRSFIAGGSLAAAIWTFEGITRRRFPNGLPLEMTIEVFRTYKGDIEKGVPGSLTVRKSQDGREVGRRRFRVQGIRHRRADHSPRSSRRGDGKGTRSVQGHGQRRQGGDLAAMRGAAQNFGVAQADMYLRAGDASFALNFVKGYLGIWLQSLLVITLGVTFSTFLSGPVAMLATLGALIGGFFNDFMYRLATHRPTAAARSNRCRRLVTQQNVTSRNGAGPANDRRARRSTAWRNSACGCCRRSCPTSDDSASPRTSPAGSTFPATRLLMYTCRAFAFLLPVFVVGYLCLKNRR